MSKSIARTSTTFTNKWFTTSSMVTCRAWYSFNATGGSVNNCRSSSSQLLQITTGERVVVAGYPTQIMAVDLMGPLTESKSGNRYVMVVGDYFSRWMEAIPVPNREATTVAEKLVDEVFLRFSPPEQLHSDQGRQF